jgi:addiction module HigA family antidote
MIKRTDLETMDFSDVSTGAIIPVITPGEILKVEFMEPLGLSARALARELGVPANRITEIINGTRAITAETALLLGRRFGTTAELWMNLQTAYALEEARLRMPALA